MAKNIIAPLQTEKAYALSQKNVYAFNVPLSLNKNQIKEAIEKEFQVTVTGVRIVVQAGKVKRINKSLNKKRFVAGTTKLKDTKKAYVSLKEGDKIAIFEEASETQTEEKK